MPTKSDVTHYAWIDLETTGSDPRFDAIIEVGLIITDRELDKKATLNLIVNPSLPGSRFPDWRARIEANPVVKDMHTTNGLLRDVPLGVSNNEAQDAIIGQFRRFGEKGQFQIAGRGVAHFDLQVLKEQMPAVTKWLRDATLDVGCIGRLIRDVAKRPDLLLDRSTSKRKAHRAMHDVTAYLEEARHYAAIIDEIPVIDE